MLDGASVGATLFFPDAIGKAPYLLFTFHNGPFYLTLSARKYRIVTMKLKLAVLAGWNLDRRGTRRTVQIQDAMNLGEAL
jgi:hypothetical protein